MWIWLFDVHWSLEVWPSFKRQKENMCLHTLQHHQNFVHSWTITTTFLCRNRLDLLSVFTPSILALLDAFPAWSQISAQLNWCAPAAIQADRLFWSRVGHMLLGASALNFYSSTSGEERTLLQKWGLHRAGFLLEFGATTRRENVILCGLGVISIMNSVNIQLWS